MTTIAYERHAVHPDKTAEYELLVEKYLAGLRQAPGVLWADAAWAFDDRPGLILMSEWRGTADLDSWESAEDFAEFHAHADVWQRDTPTRRRLSPDF